MRQIYDKFPEKKGGLKELYEKGPQTSFFLVKFWVCTQYSIIQIRFLFIQWPVVPISGWFFNSI